LLGVVNGSLTMPATASQASTNVVSFPEQSQAASPNGRYVIVGENHAEPFHTAILEDRALKTRRKLFDYDRHIDLLWNPDSKSFALTDYEESDYSRCSIIFIDQTLPTIRVWDKLVKALTQRTGKVLSRTNTYTLLRCNGLRLARLRSKSGATVRLILRASRGFTVTIEMVELDG
jgi:hypothetical protein